MNPEHMTLALAVIATVLLGYTVQRLVDAIFKFITLLFLWDSRARFRNLKVSTGNEARVKLYVFFFILQPQITHKYKGIGQCRRPYQRGDTFNANLSNHRLLCLDISSVGTVSAISKGAPGRGRGESHAHPEFSLLNLIKMVND
jgi:hypothetical protein